MREELSKDEHLKRTMYGANGESKLAIAIHVHSFVRSPAAQPIRRLSSLESLDCTEDSFLGATAVVEASEEGRTE